MLFLVLISLSKWLFIQCITWRSHNHSEAEREVDSTKNIEACTDKSIWNHSDLQEFKQTNKVAQFQKSI